MNRSRNRPANHRPSGNFRRLRNGLVVIAGIIITAIWGSAATVVWTQRSATLSRAQDSASNLALAFEAQIGQSLADLDNLSRQLDRHIELEGSRFDLSDWTRRNPLHSAFVFQVGLIDERGMLYATNRGPVRPPIDLGDTEHFRVQRNGDSGVLFVSKPVFLRSSHRWSLQVSHRIKQQGGRFAGVSVFSLDPEYFVRLYESIDIGADGMVALIGLDGTVRVRVGERLDPENAKMGTSIDGSAMQKQIEAIPDGSVVTVSPIDQIARIYGYRRVRGYPLTVLVGYGMRDALAPWKNSALWIVAATGLATGMLALLTYYLVAQLKQRARYEQMLIEKQTNLKAANDELASAKQAAESANRAKSEFLANMSHELRTPLNAILGFSEIISAESFGPVGDAKYAEYAKDIHASGRHLLELISDILDLAKVEAGRMILNEEELQLPPLVESCLRLVSVRAAATGVAVHMHLADDLPLLRADPRQLRQVLLNLLSNAVKFTPAGGEVLVSAELQSSGWLTLTVRDSGIGIAVRDIPMALSPFVQVDGGLNRRYEGTGLGLPLAKALVELHDGELRLDSAPGQGTTVTVRLPPARVIRRQAAEPVVAQRPMIGAH